MTTLSERRALTLQLEKNFQRQVSLLIELAAAYSHEGRPVPPELGEALGAVEYRRRAFQQIKGAIEDGARSPVVKRYIQDIAKHNEAIQRLIALHKDTPCL
jgi:hypothetical protein